MRCGYSHLHRRTTPQLITRLAIEDLTAERVRQFLSLEKKRGNHIRTRNLRLAALHTFFAYLARQVPEAIAEAQRVAAIPRKGTPRPKTQFAGLSKTGRAMLRDRTLLLFCTIPALASRKWPI
jgi:site-specific recombinase XerC